MDARDVLARLVAALADVTIDAPSAEYAEALDALAEARAYLATSPHEEER